MYMHMHMHVYTNECAHTQHTHTHTHTHLHLHKMEFQTKAQTSKLAIQYAQTHKKTHQTCTHTKKTLYRLSVYLLIRTCHLKVLYLDIQNTLIIHPLLYGSLLIFYFVVHVLFKRKQKKTVQLFNQYFCKSQEISLTYQCALRYNPPDDFSLKEN